jgi:hypothetical protein
MFDTHLKVKHITHRGPPEPVYNVTVHNEHTYFISHSALLVHNNNSYDDELATNARNAALEDMAREDALLDTHDALFYGGEGVVYLVHGSKTQSGKPYIGSADDLSVRTKTANDGRDRSQAITIGRYPIGNTTVRRKAEQIGIDDNGGLDALDNKRNEIVE